MLGVRGVVVGEVRRQVASRISGGDLRSGIRFGGLHFSPYDPRYQGGCVGIGLGCIVYMLASGANRLARSNSTVSILPIKFHSPLMLSTQRAG